MDRWHIELRKGHSRDGQSRHVICNEDDERIAVVSLNGACGGNPDCAAVYAALLASVPELNDKLLGMGLQRDRLLEICKKFLKAIEMRDGAILALAGIRATQAILDMTEETDER